MFKKRVLLADADARAAEEFRQALGEAWEVKSVADGTAALADMEMVPSDVVIADLDLAEIDGAELLNRIHATHPKAVRFVLAREADHERVVKKVLGAHQFLGKPLDPLTLKSAIERACALAAWIPKNSIRELVGRIRTLPTIPSLYLEVQALLKSPDVTTEQVGSVIAKDMAMMTRLLQVLNSASFGLPRKITNPTEAVGLLGFETISSMVMTIKLLSQYDKVKPVYFSIDRLWRHSTEVARNAQQITRLHTGDNALAEAAFTAGLLHDVGKVVLAANFDEQYRGAQSLARKQQLPLCEVEKEIFGASHGEIGAYLLGLWGMPLDILEAAALHHHPSLATSQTFSPLTAVHVANALLHEIQPDKEGMVPSKIDHGYLTQIGVLEHLAGWRATVAGTDTGKPTPKTSFVKATQSKPAAPAAPAAPVGKPASAPFHPAIEREALPKSEPFFRHPRTYAGAAIALIFLVFVIAGPFRHRPTKPPAASEDSAKPTASAANPQPSALPLIAPLAVHARTGPDSGQPAADSTVPIATRPSSEPGFENMKLQGIIFSSSNPSAIINGKTVQAHDHIGDVLIVEIKNSSVTLEYKKKFKTLVLN